MDTRAATTVRTKTDAAHTLLFPLAEAVSTAMGELDDAIGLTTDAVDAAESHAEDLDLMATTPAEHVQLKAARAHIGTLEELRGQLESLHSAAEQAHTYIEETSSLYDSSVEALDQIATT
jgi:hypothetical protein